MIYGYPIWAIILTGAIFVTCLGMTLPIYFNLGGELIYPIGEAHGQDYSNNHEYYYGSYDIIWDPYYGSCDMYHII